MSRLMFAVCYGYLDGFVNVIPKIHIYTKRYIRSANLLLGHLTIARTSRSPGRNPADEARDFEKINEHIVNVLSTLVK